MKKIILKLLVGALCLSALIGIAIILFGTFEEIESKILLTTILIFGYSIPGLCSSTIYEKDKLRLFSILGILIALIACLYMIGLLWEILEFDLFSLDQWKIIFSLNFLCWSSGHISLILLINNKNKLVSLFKTITVICSVIIDIMIFILVWNILEPSDFYHKLMWILGILITLGTIGTPILNKIYKSKENTNNVLPNTNNNQDTKIFNNEEVIKENSN